MNGARPKVISGSAVRVTVCGRLPIAALRTTDSAAVVTSSPGWVAVSSHSPTPEARRTDPSRVHAPVAASATGSPTLDSADTEVSSP